MYIKCSGSNWYIEITPKMVVVVITAIVIFTFVSHIYDANFN